MTQETQRNWLLFTHGSTVYVVYSVQPHTVLALGRNGECSAAYSSSNLVFSRPAPRLPTCLRSAPARLCYAAALQQTSPYITLRWLVTHHTAWFNVARCVHLPRTT